MVEGTIYEYQILKGADRKPIGKYEYTYTSVKASAHGSIGKLEVQQFRENGKPIEKPARYTVTCSSENVKIKPDSTNWPAMSMGTMTLNNEMKEGQTLPSVTTKFVTEKNPNKEFGLLEVYNYTVKKKESVTIALGTFDAFVVEYDIFAKPGLAPPKIHLKEYYVAGKGLVKSERYGPNGGTVFITVELIGERKK